MKNKAKLKSGKVIFFDLYQTLIDVNIDNEKQRRDQEGWKIFAEILKNEYRTSIAPGEFLALYEKRRDDFYSKGRDLRIHHHNMLELVSAVLKENLDLSLSKEKISSLLYEFHKVSCGYIRLYPGIFEILSLLSKKYILSAASHTQGCYTQIDLKELGIEQFFSHFIYTSDVGFRKESVNFYKKCLEIVGKKAEDCVMVGDNYDVDVLVPQQLGMKTIWVKNTATSDRYLDLLKEEPKDMINIEKFNRFQEVIDCVFNG